MLFVDGTIHSFELHRLHLLAELLAEAAPDSFEAALGLSGDLRLINDGDDLSLNSSLFSISDSVIPLILLSQYAASTGRYCVYLKTSYAISSGRPLA